MNPIPNMQTAGRMDRMQPTDTRPAAELTWPELNARMQARGYPEHTPGPWIVTDDLHAGTLTDCYTIQRTFPGGAVQSICATYGDPARFPVVTANARLIAQAPALLAGLIKAVGILESCLPEYDLDDETGDGARTLREFRETIAAARHWGAEDKARMQPRGEG